MVSILFVYNFLGSLCLFLWCSNISLVGGLIYISIIFAFLVKMPTHTHTHTHTHRVLVGKLEGKRPLGRTRRRWKDNIKMDLQEVRRGDVDWNRDD